MTMTRRDFAAVAAVLARFRWTQPSSEADGLAASMADALAETNPRFNRARFLAACEVPPHAGADMNEPGKRRRG